MAYYKAGSIYVTENSKVRTVTGAIANFNTSLVLPLIDVKAEIKAVETGTGAKSPSNPYVISGFNGANLYQCGVNVLDEVFELGGIDYVTGEDTPASDRLRTKNYIPVKNVDFYLYNGGSYTLAMRYYSANKVFLGSRAITTSKVLTYGTLDLPTGTAFIRIVITGQTTYSNNISLNYPSTKTDYIAYNPNGTVYPVSWQTEAGEVFGGYYDFTTGKLVVTHKDITNMSSLNWQYQSAYLRFITTDLNSKIKRTADNNKILDGLSCSIYETSSANRTAGASYDNIIGASTSGMLSLRDTSLNGDLTALSTRLKNKALVYPLATPVEYDLTPQQILPLLGVNNIWNDTNGDTTVKY